MSLRIMQNLFEDHLDVCSIPPAWLELEGPRSVWTRKYFLIQDNCLFYFDRAEDVEKRTVRGVVPLTDCLVRDPKRARAGRSALRIEAALLTVLSTIGLVPATTGSKFIIAFPDLMLLRLWKQAMIKAAGPPLMTGWLYKEETSWRRKFVVLRASSVTYSNDDKEHTGNSACYPVLTSSSSTSGSLSKSKKYPFAFQITSRTAKGDEVRIVFASESGEEISRWEDALHHANQELLTRLDYFLIAVRKIHGTDADPHTATKGMSSHSFSEGWGRSVLSEDRLKLFVAQVRSSNDLTRIFGHHSDEFFETSKVFWMQKKNAKSCYECTILFSTFTRKYHCLMCGRVFCSKCTQKLVVEQAGRKTQMRMCQFCSDSRRRDHQSALPDPSPSSPSCVVDPMANIETPAAEVDERYLEGIREEPCVSLSTPAPEPAIEVPDVPSSVDDSQKKAAYISRQKDFDVCVFAHLTRIAHYLCKKEGLAEEWVEIISALARDGGNQIQYLPRGVMDVRECIKVKRVPGGSAAECTYVDGVVFTKNVAHKKMVTNIANPKILVIGCPIEYERGQDVKMTQLEFFGEQEKEYLGIVISKLVSFNPDIVVAEKSVSRCAQEMLLAAKTTLVLNVKPSIINRLCTLTGAVCMNSTDISSPPKMGICRSFAVTSWKVNERTKPLMYFQGVLERLGGTFFLRGGDMATLTKVKNIVKFCAFCFHNLKQETQFLVDVGACIPRHISAETSPSLPAVKSRAGGEAFLVSISPFVCYPLPAKTSRRAPSLLDGNFADSCSDDDEPAAPEISREIVDPNLYADESLIFDGQPKSATRLWSWGAHDFSECGHVSVLISSFTHTEVVEECVHPVPRRLYFHRRHDVSLWTYLSQFAFTSEVTCKGTKCGLPMICHERSFTHLNARVTMKCSVEEGPAGFDPNKLTLGVFCRSGKMGDEEGEGEKVLSSVNYLSRISCDMSLARFLETMMYNVECVCFHCHGAAASPPPIINRNHEFVFFLSGRAAHFNVHKTDVRIFQFPQSPLFKAELSLADGHFELEISTFGRAGEHVFQTVLSRVEIVVEDLSYDPQKDRNAKLISSLQFLVEDLNVIRETLFAKISEAKTSLKNRDFAASIKKEIFVFARCFNIALANSADDYSTLGNQLRWAVETALENKNGSLRFTHMSLEAPQAKAMDPPDRPSEAESLGETVVDKDRLSQKFPDVFPEGMEVEGQQTPAECGDSVDVSTPTVAHIAAENVNGAQDSNGSEGKEELESSRRVVLEVESESKAVEEETSATKTAEHSQLVETAEIKPEDISCVRSYSTADADFPPDSSECSGTSIGEAATTVENAASLQDMAGSLTSYSSDETPRDLSGGANLSIFNSVVSGGEVLRSKRGECDAGEEEEEYVNVSEFHRASSSELGRTLGSSIGAPSPQHPGSTPRTAYRKSIRYKKSVVKSANCCLSKTFLDSNFGLCTHMLIGISGSTVVINEGEPSSILAYGLGLLSEGGTQLDTDASTKSARVVSLYSKTAEEGAAALAKIGIEEGNLHLNINFESESFLGPVSFQIRVLFAWHFTALRDQIIDGGENSFCKSLSRCMKWEATGGKSGCNFSKTWDDRFVIKEVSKVELEGMEKFGETYCEYLAESVAKERPSALCKILGAFKIKYRAHASGKIIRRHLIVMENLFYNKKISRTFDLKGSRRNRMVKTDREDVVLMDDNLLEYLVRSPLFVTEEQKAKLSVRVWNDTLFLSKVGVMDYSLLVGMDDDSGSLIVGIIDYIRLYTWDKQMESLVKSSSIVSALSGAGKPTIIDPSEYQRRFRAAMNSYFISIPPKFNRHDHCKDEEITN